ncbi:MAG: ABC transporter substrate-binding protein [Nitriliruptor sp.]
MGRRVVSLLPATTEIVAALGHAGSLVGRSHECDFPAEVTELPIISRPRREPIGTSAEIHRSVTELVGQVLSIYELDPEALREAAPDLIVTQDLCRVCAVAESEVVAAARDHLGGAVEVLTCSPVTFADVLEDVGRIGTALGDADAGAALADAMRGGLAALRSTVAGRERPRLTLLEWTDPLMAGGNWAAELVEAAGADPVLGARGGHSPTVDAAALRAADPDVLVVAPCGYDLARAQQEAAVLERLEGWRELTAVRAGRVAFVDGSAYVNRPGPRLVDTAEILAAIAHGIGPAVDLEGTAWAWWA